MNKVTVTLDAAKLRSLVANRTYKNREGVEVTVQEVKFDLVEVKEPKTVYTSDKFDIVKTHFAAEIQTREQREAKEETNFIGEGATIVWKNDEPQQKAPKKSTAQKIDDEDDDLPF